MVQKYEDVVRDRLNAQIPVMAEELSRRLTECHHDAARRGLGGGFALQMVIEAYAADTRLRGERFWQTVKIGRVQPE